MPLTWIIYIAAATAPLAAYGYGVAKTKIDMTRKMHTAVFATRADEQAQCRVRIGDVEKRINDAAESRIRKASEAPVVETPSPNELATLCAKSASCRERK